MLKPCQCSFDDAKIENHLPERNIWRIYCPNCGMCTDYVDSREEAIEVWNCRPIENALQADVDRLRRLLPDVIMSLRLSLDAMGDCDHSVNICVCPERELLDNVKAALKDGER